MLIVCLKEIRNYQNLTIVLVYATVTCSLIAMLRMIETLDTVTYTV